VPALESKPEAFVDLRGYWQAFQVLNNSRQLAFGDIGAIPLSEIKAYFDLVGITELNEKEEYLYFIQLLDIKYLEWHRKRPKATKSKKKKSLKSKMPVKRKK